MPSKKKVKLEKGQTTLSFSSSRAPAQPDPVNNAATDVVPLQLPSTSSTPTTETTLKKKTVVLKFSEEWLQTRPWLRYDKEENVMWCDTCRAGKI